MSSVVVRKVPNISEVIIKPEEAQALVRNNCNDLWLTQWLDLGCNAEKNMKQLVCSNAFICQEKNLLEKLMTTSRVACLSANTSILFLGKHSKGILILYKLLSGVFHFALQNSDCHPDRHATNTTNSQFAHVCWQIHLLKRTHFLLLVVSNKIAFTRRKRVKKNLRASEKCARDIALARTLGRPTRDGYAPWPTKQVKNHLTDLHLLQAKCWAQMQLDLF